MKPKNIEEAKALIKKYRSITIEKIKRLWGKQPRVTFFRMGEDVANKLTGFGRLESCPLCHPITKRLRPNCNECIYRSASFSECQIGENEKTYDAIYGAETPRQLLTAFHKRADHIEKLLKKNGWMK
jgi:hypothetical protein